MPRKSSLYVKMLCAFLCIAFFPVLLYGGYTLIFTQSGAWNNASKTLTERVSESSVALEEMLSFYASRSEIFCSSEDVISLILQEQDGTIPPTDLQSLYRKLYKLNEGNTSLPVVCVTNVAGKPIAAVGADSTVMDRWNTLHGSLLSMLRLEDKSSISLPCQYNTLSGEAVVLSTVREIRSSGVLVGYLFVDLTSSVLQETLQRPGKIDMDGDYIPVSYFIYTWYNYSIYNDYLTDFSRGKNLLDLPFRDEFKSDIPVTLTHEQNGVKFLMAGQQIFSKEFILLGAVPVNLLAQNNTAILTAIMILSLISVLLCSIVATRLTKSITAPISQMLTTMYQVEQGDFTARAQVTRKDELGSLASELNSMVTKMDILKKQDLEKQRRLFLAEFYNLQSQIRPHFLYNALDCIKWLAKLGEMEQVSIMTTNLGEILKRCVTTGGEMETIADSVSFIESYLEILQMCYQEKLSTVFNIEKALLPAPILRFLLQPLVENSVMHGIEPKIAPGTLTVSIQPDGENIKLVVADDGVGIAPDILENLLQPGTGDHGNELYNIERRIKLHYGQDYGLSITSVQGLGTTITVTIPNHLKKEES